MYRKLFATIILGLVLVGCTPVQEPTLFETEAFSIEVPANLKQFPPRSPFDLAYFSDMNSTSFNEAALAVYTYQDYFLADSVFNQGYCEFISRSIFNRSFSPDANLFSGIDIEMAEFHVGDANIKPFCETQFRLYNKDLNTHVNNQLHRQKVFISGQDEVVVEISTVNADFPSYLVDSLNNLTIK